MGFTRQESEPPEEAVREIAPGILRCQLPVDMPGLGHVNTYLMVDRNGAALVDAGIPGVASWDILVARLRDAGLGARDVHTVVVTHSHPDHFGGAHRLAAEAGARIVTHGAWQTRWARARHACADAELDDSGGALPDVDPEDVPATDPWVEPTPWGGESFVSRWLAEHPGDAAGDRAGGWLPPEPDLGVADGEALTLGGRRWSCLYTPGHTLDHLCLFDPDSGVLLSGDHVLPTITPHIPGVGGGRDPLASYLASLERVAELPGTGLVLPAHGQPFADLAARVSDIRAHHRDRLDRLCEIAAAIGPATVVAYSHELFREARWGPMAESEAYAHLRHLYLTGRLTCRGTGAELVFDLAHPD